MSTDKDIDSDKEETIEKEEKKEVEQPKLLRLIGEYIWVSNHKQCILRSKARTL